MNCKAVVVNVTGTLELTPVKACGFEAGSNLSVELLDSLSDHGINVML